MAKINNFKCPKENCGYVTRRKHNLTSHLQLHEPPSISCPQPNCSYTSNTKNNLSRHMRVHLEGEKRLKCAFCPYASDHSTNFTNHVRTHTGETPFKCPEPDCNYQTAVNCHLKQHAKVHSGIRQFKCPLCDHNSKHKRTVRDHLLKMHGEDASSIASEPCKICHFPIDSVNCPHLTETPFQCPQKRCKFRSRTVEKLNGHQLTHSIEKHLKCPHSSCQFRTAHKGSLGAHVKLHEETPEKFFQCPLCPYKSRLKSYVSIHLRSGIHDGKERQRTFKCPEAGCNYSAFNNKSLTLHLESHNPEKSFKCLEPGCFYRTHGKTLLKKHANVHSKEKPWKCNLCLMTLCSSGSLSRHIRTHTKETLLKCPETGCQFRANRKRALTFHLRAVHWKIRPYKCPMCKYSATRKDTWKTHQRKVHGIIVQNPSFECTASGCEVVAKNEKELAIHFTSRHNLPRVLVAMEMV